MPLGKNAMQMNRIHMANANTNSSELMYFCKVSQGELIKEWRIYKGLSQEELSFRSGVDVSSISQIEGGRHARIDTLKKIAYGLGIQVTDLSHRPVNDLTRQTRAFDLKAWLDDENATFEGKPVSKRDKELIEQMFRRLYERENPGNS